MKKTEQYLVKHITPIALSIGLLTTAPLLALTSNSPRDDSFWQAEYVSVCKYDEALCKKLKNADGTWHKPKEEVLKAIEVLKDVIKDAADLYGVDPRAVAGAILAENSLNVSISDDIQNFLVKYKIAPKGSIFGKSFSFGWGQLNMPAAMDAEPLAARIEGRTRRNDDEIARELLKPESAVRYVAAVIRQAQDVYANRGMDISHSPGVLATLYNLGNPQERVRHAEQFGRPRLNYFGLFVEYHTPTLERALGLHDPTMGKVSAVPVKDTDGVTAKTTSKAKEQPGPRVQATFLKSTVTSKTLDLVAAPKMCPADKNKQTEEYYKYSNLTFFPSVGKIKAGSTFEIITPGLGCDLEEWSLIRGDDGSQGWANDEILKAGSRESMRASTTCVAQESGACEKSVISKTTTSRLQSEMTGELAFALAGQAWDGEGFSEKLGSKKVTLVCMPFEYSKGPHGRSGIGVRAMYPGITQLSYLSQPNPPLSQGVTRTDAKRLSEDEISGIQSQIQEFKDRFLQTLNPKPNSWDDYSNPYRFLFNGNSSWVYRENGLGVLDSCLRKDGLPPLIACGLSDFERQKLKTALSQDIPRKPTYVELKRVLESFSIKVDKTPIGKVNKGEDGEDPALLAEKLQQRKDKLSALFAPCLSIDPKLKRSHAVIDEVVKLIGDMSVDNVAVREKYIDSTLENGVKHCENINRIRHRTSEQPKNTSCSTCYVHLGNPNAGGAGTYVNSFDDLTALLRTDDDQDIYLEDQLSVMGYSQYLTSKNYPVAALPRPSDCAVYDPFKTAAVLENILKDSCVMAVFVPDAWLIMKLEKYKPQVIYRPFAEDDRFVVDISEKRCVGGGK